VKQRTNIKKPFVNHIVKKQRFQTNNKQVCYSSKNNVLKSTIDQTRKNSEMDKIINNENENKNKISNMIKNVSIAQNEMELLSQEQVDHIFREVALEANKYRVDFAKDAHEETGMGVFEDKIIKNHFASEFIYNKYKHDKTVGIIHNDTQFGLKKIAEPIGTILAICPVTNPTSTAIFKILIVLKTQNTIIVSLHPRSSKSTVNLCEILLKTAVNAGAPKHCIGWVENPTLENINFLTHHDNISIILATGGSAMVRSAYSSGKPAIGVGPGNTPAMFHSSANIKQAVHQITMSKTFDNGMICASEQVVVAENKQMDEILKEFTKQGAYILKSEEMRSVADLLFVKNKNGQFGMNPDIVGKSAIHIASIANIKVPKHTTLLICDIHNSNLTSLFAHEKLCPVLGAVRANDFDQVLQFGKIILENGGMGHTSVLFIDDNETECITKCYNTMPSGRSLINMPSAYGAIGDIYNFKLIPSLTLGCGSKGGNSIPENVGPHHLLNIKNVAEKRENMLWFKVPESIYFKNGILSTALVDLLEAGISRVQIITDWPMKNLGYVNIITDILHEYKMDTNVFVDITPDPTLSCIKAGIRDMKSFKPDCIIALGGGSPMDASKVMRLMYEHPAVDFKDLYIRFMDIRKRIIHFPNNGSLIKKLVSDVSG
jgi:acetaldehyde dehydrogenase/alcohol dehydrogenase